MVFQWHHCKNTLLEPLFLILVCMTVVLPPAKPMVNQQSQTDTLLHND